jgi:hypothetical protein
MLENAGLLGVLCLILIIGLGFPISAYLRARRGQGNDEVSVYRNLVRRARNPWEVEDSQLEELAKRVKKLADDEE